MNLREGPVTRVLQPVRAALGERAGSGSATAVTLPERFRPDGVAMLLGSDGFGRVFLCDRRNHVIDVVDQDARPLFSFGGHGEGPGQFNDPCDIVVVPLTHEPVFAIEQALFAVADRGNGRVQIFDGVGTLVALLAPSGLFGQWNRLSGTPPVAILTPAFARPSRLAWAPPHLVVAGSYRGVVRIDLGAAFLPAARTTARSALGGVLRRVLAAPPFGARPTRRADGSPIRSAVRSPTRS